MTPVRSSEWLGIAFLDFAKCVALTPMFFMSLLYLIKSLCIHL